MAHRARSLREGDCRARGGNADERSGAADPASARQRLNAGLILRALLSGNIALFEEALAELADMPVARVSALVHDRGSAGLRALLDRSGLPPSTYPAFKAAIEAMHEGGFVGEPGGTQALEIDADHAHSRGAASAQSRTAKCKDLPLRADPESC